MGTTAASEYLSVSDVADLIGAKPRHVSDAFYNRQLRDDLAPIIAGRRVIHRSLIGAIVLVLRRNGHPVPKPRESQWEK